MMDVSKNSEQLLKFRIVLINLTLKRKIAFNSDFS